MGYATFAAILVIALLVSWAVGVKMGAHFTVKRIKEEMDK
jgi:hypothetical protein